MASLSNLSKFIKLTDIADEPNNHQNGVKRVFIKDEDTNSMLTQVAYGFMQAGESSGLHQHPSMDEYFYFTKGTGIYAVGEDEFIVEPKTFVRVPASTLHNLVHTGAEALEFVYFGIAV